MSIEAVNQFLTKVGQDQQLQAEVNRVIETGNARQAVTELGAKQGYEFTPEELASQFQKIQTQLANNELSEEELEAVAGGVLFDPVIIPTLTPPPGTDLSAFERWI